MSQTKVLVIGLDGATPELIRKYVSEGKLPNLSKLIKNGVSGSLTSTIPLVSTSIWTSFITGKNPGKHNIFGITAYKRGSYDHKLINSLDRRGETLWHILARRDKKVGILNLPLTYPPEEANGFIVSGMLTPKKSCTFTYPITLQKELLENVKGYEIDVTITKIVWMKNKDAFIRKIYDITKSRAEATTYLMNRKDWNLFIVVFTDLDRLQHFFWKYMEENDPRYGEVILKYHQFLDKIIGKLLGNVGGDVMTVIMSDHGFVPVYKSVYLNNFLMIHNLLNLKRKMFSRLKRLFVQHVVNLASGLLVRLGFDVEIINEIIPWKMREAITVTYFSWGDVDWDKTKAYFSVGIGDGIRINLQGREPNGVVKPEEYETMRAYLIEKLNQIKDPKTGKKVIDRVYRREEIYSGHYVANAPDLVVLMEDGYSASEKFDNGLVVSELATINVAEHKKNGILIMTGPNIRKGIEIKNSVMCDIAPTILYAMGVAIPLDMDGRAILDAFEPVYITSHPLRYEEVKFEEKARERRLSKKEEEEVKRRLKALGYLE